MGGNASGQIGDGTFFLGRHPVLIDTADKVVLGFGPVYPGLYGRYNNSSWSILHYTMPPEIAGTADIDGNGSDDLLIDFGISIGLWVRYDSGTWKMLNPLSALFITAGKMDTE